MFISLLSYTKLSNPSGFERYNMRDKKIIIKVSEKEKDLVQTAGEDVGLQTSTMARFILLKSLKNEGRNIQND